MSFPSSCIPFYPSELNEAQVQQFRALISPLCAIQGFAQPSCKQLVHKHEAILQE
jgi:hypothetical protein